MTQSGPKETERPDCLHCEHYYVTWEAERPRGCRAYAFKSEQTPSDVVLASSGEPCQFFARKAEPGGRTKLIR